MRSVECVLRWKVDGAERNGFGFSSAEIGEATGFHGTTETSAAAEAAAVPVAADFATVVALAVAIAIDSASARATATTTAMVVFAGTTAESAAAVSGYAAIASGWAAAGFAGSSNSAPCAEASGEAVASVVSILETQKKEKERKGSVLICSFGLYLLHLVIRNTGC